MPWLLMAMMAAVCVSFSTALAGEGDGRMASGPLRVDPANPRYFADAQGKAVLLTGFHTWNDLQEMGADDPPKPFDYDRYLDQLAKCGVNYIRLWRWEMPKYRYSEDDAPRYCSPQPWPRTGPGDARDGKPRFDLTRFDADYFGRLHERVAQAGRRGIYVSIMLFEGHCAQFGAEGWEFHPFAAGNNVNGIDAGASGHGRAFYTLTDPAVTRLQEAYVCKVVDTVNDLDNVLYEISNEAGPYSTEWQYHMIRLIKEYEAHKPRQHPVGMTFQYQGGSNSDLFKGPADWISPNPDGGYRDDPPPADGSKVILSDTDHLWGLGGNRAWAWKTLTRGMQPVFMDPWPEGGGLFRGMTVDEVNDLRRNLGYVARYAAKMDLARAVPHGELASSGCCLADPGREYLVYLPGGGQVEVDLSAVHGQATVEWFSPGTGRAVEGKPKPGGGRVALQASSEGDAVLYVHVEPGLSATRGTVRFIVHDRALARVDDRLFGQFMERPSWGEIGVEGAVVSEAGELQPRVLELLAEMRVPVVRFPGGTDVDYIDWRDMVDNVPGRQGGRPVTTGHTGQQVTNRFGYDEFLRLSEQLGWQDIIVVNLGDALLGRKPARDAALHAAGLVAYCNAPVGASLPADMPDWPAVRAANGHPKPYGVRYIQLGNETWALRDKAEEVRPGRWTEFFVETIEEYERAIHAVDPAAVLLMDYDEAATPLLRERLGDRIAYICTHFYVPWGIRSVKRDGVEVPVKDLTAEDVWYCWIAAPELDQDGLSVLRADSFAAAQRLGYKVAVTEWNWNGGWWGHEARPAAPDSDLARGLGAAGMLHALMRRADVVEMGTQSMLVGIGWNIAAISVDRSGLLPARMRPSGMVTMMYSQHHGDRLMAMDSAGVPCYRQPFEMGGIKPAEKVAVVDALATVSDGAAFLHAINRSFDRPIPVALDLTELGPTADTAKMHVLQGRLERAGDVPAAEPLGWIAQQVVPVKEGVASAELPPRSVAVIEVPRTGRAGD
jgi:alpha-L-arabinofuranosidase